MHHYCCKDLSLLLAFFEIKTHKRDWKVNFHSKFGQMQSERYNLRWRVLIMAKAIRVTGIR